MWRDLGEMARVRTNVQIALAPFPEVHHKIFHLAVGCFGETMASAQFWPLTSQHRGPLLCPWFSFSVISQIYFG